MSACLVATAGLSFVQLPLAETIPAVAVALLAMNLLLGEIRDDRLAIDASCRWCGSPHGNCRARCVRPHHVLRAAWWDGDGATRTAARSGCRHGRSRPSPRGLRGDPGTAARHRRWDVGRRGVLRRGERVHRADIAARDVRIGGAGSGVWPGGRRRGSRRSDRGYGSSSTFSTPRSAARCIASTPRSSGYRSAIRGVGSTSPRSRRRSAGAKGPQREPTTVISSTTNGREVERDLAGVGRLEHEGAARPERMAGQVEAARRAGRLDHDVVRTSGDVRPRRSRRWFCARRSARWSA